jgi:beta-lactam-binding protein with PASTA domain
MQKQGTAVVLTVSKGEDQVTIPNVVGQSADAAEQLLTSSFGLVVARAEEPNDTVPAGSVIRTDPGTDATVSKGSTVTLVVSTGPTQVAVPFVTGLTETQATQKLTEAGLLSSITYQDVPFGSPNDKRVLSQSTAPTQLVDSSSTIALVVGKALPAPTTTTTPPTSAAPTSSSPPASTTATTTPPTATTEATTTT